MWQERERAADRSIAQSVAANGTGKPHLSDTLTPKRARAPAPPVTRDALGAHAASEGPVALNEGPGANGLPPPSLNGTGHTFRDGRGALGGGRKNPGVARMPGLRLNPSAG